MSATVFERILLEDGVRIPPGGGAEKSIRCFSPTHDDKEPSMSVNVLKGVYNCHGCGIKGNAWDYLRDIRGLSPNEARKCLADAGSTDVYSGTLRDGSVEKTGTPTAKPVLSVSRIPARAKTKGNLVGIFTKEYEYRDAAGVHVFSVARYDATTDAGEGVKSFRQYTVNPEGGYHPVGPVSQSLPLSLRRKRYLIYRCHELHREKKSWEGRPEVEHRQIWLVEGEKCADAIANLRDIPGGKPHPPVVSLCGGSNVARGGKFEDYHDLTPLYGTKILLIADADDTGRKFMRRLGLHLADHGCSVRYLLPDGNTGADIADACGKGWAGLQDFVRHCGGVKSHEEVHPEKEPDETKAPMPPMDDSPFFRVLGTEGEHIVFQQKVTHKIIKLMPQALMHDGNIINLAPLEYWRTMTGGKDISKAHKLVWADAMIRGAEERGEISTMATRMWGRGAIKTKTGEIVYNLGNRILVEDPKTGLMGIEKPLADENIREIYLPGPEIVLKDTGDAAAYCREAYRAIMAYRWEKTEYGSAFCGWLVSSLIGGALPFRPMLWITSKAGYGKTFLLDEVISRFHEGVITELANTSEAGMAAQSQDSSLPVYLDEFEPAQGKEYQMQQILALIRIATSGGAGRSRGNSSGGFTNIRLRFSLMIASIDRPVLSDADDQRITPISLGEGVEDWPGVKRGILEAMHPEKCIAMRTHIIRNTARIVETAGRIENDLAENGGVETRAAQIRSALSAGVSFLTGKEFVLPERDVRLKNDNRPFHALMQSIVKSDGYEDLTVAQAITGAWFPQYTEEITADTEVCRRVSERHGFKFMENLEYLACAVDWRPMHSLLKGTPFASMDLDEYLPTIPGAKRYLSGNGKRGRLTFSKQRSPCIIIPIDSLRDMGLFDFGFD